MIEITHGRCRNKDLLNLLNSWTVSDTLNSIILDKTCFCNIIIHFEFTCMISKKEKIM